ncbi:MAG TPA: hypothetical protein VFY16_03775 [Gemmatimonadaceae bacterium]|nr:hypothetical protein [Gemmatimonadaceae bacterium]
MGQTLRGGAGDRGRGRSAAAWRLTAWRSAVVLLLLLFGARWPAPLEAQEAGVERLDAGRFTFVAHPRDVPLARSLLARAAERDTFPGLPRPRARVVVAVATDADEFRRLVGPAPPEWGAAVAFPASQRIVLQGRRASGEAGDPRVVLRHELAHLALHETLGDRPPRWFDEGYAGWAAGEWGRQELLATNVALLLRGMPGLDSLNGWFRGGEGRAQAAYALSYRAVAELDAMDPERGLALLFQYWRSEGTLDRAVRAAYGLTLPQFEDRWQRRTRLRYGALAIFGDLSLAALAFVILLLPLWLLRRRRDRRRLTALRQADAAEREQQRLVDELLGRSTSPAPEMPGDSANPL